MLFRSGVLSSAYQDCVDSGQKETAEEIINQGVPEFLSQTAEHLKEQAGQKTEEPTPTDKNLGSIILEDE